MELREFVFLTLKDDHGGHGYDHIMRVYENAMKIHKEEGGDRRVIEASCLLHDCLDEKLGLNTPEQKTKIASLLSDNSYGDVESKHILSVISRMSFHLHDEDDLTVEDMVVRDADRLDAMGKIGIDRAIAYGNSKGRPLFSEKDKEDIGNGLPPHSESTISHFFDKLLLLDRHLYTATAKKMAVPLKRELIDFVRRSFLDEGLPFDERILP